MKDESSVAYSEMVNKVGNLQEKNAKLQREISILHKKQSSGAAILIAACGSAALVGWLISAALSPVPSAKKDCYVYKVAQTPVTAFVLKPPPAPPAEAATCPEAPKCEVVEAPKAEPEAKEEVEPDKPAPKRRYRRHRARVYWRR
jgi:hypothetical protein